MERKTAYGGSLRAPGWLELNLGKWHWRRCRSSSEDVEGDHGQESVSTPLFLLARFFKDCF